jgi:hypothetical protein
MAARDASPARDVQEHLLETVPSVAIEKRGRRAVVDDPALFQQYYAVAQTFDLAHIVGGQKDRRAPRALIFLEAAANPIGGVGIERGGGLVEQKHLRLVDQRLGEGDAGLLARR